MFRSQAKKDGAEDDIAKYDGVWAVEPLGKDALTGDSGLVMKSKAKHRWEEVLQNWRLYWSNPISSAVAAKLKRPFTFREEKQLVLQYEVAFQNKLNFQFFPFLLPGGFPERAWLRRRLRQAALLRQGDGDHVLVLLGSRQLLHQDLDLRQLTDKTPYTIMFGPDKCGSESKFHLIFRCKKKKKFKKKKRPKLENLILRHVHPETGAIEEKHCKKVEGKGRGVLEEIFKDKKVGKS